MPVHGLAHRLFGVIKEDWSTALYDGFAAYRYQLFPDLLLEKNLTPSELGSLPLAKDMECHSQVCRLIYADFLSCM